jgi:hypothetical protein
VSCGNENFDQKEMHMSKLATQLLLKCPIITQNSFFDGLPPPLLAVQYCKQKKAGAGGTTSEPSDEHRGHVALLSSFAEKRRESETRRDGFLKL